MKKAVLYRKLEKKSVQCLACSWYCRISPFQTGICATRLNKNGILYSLVYGKAIGLHLDPVEKKPLHHFLPGSSIFSFGTVGCNFGCLFCQNWEMSQVNKEQNSERNILEIIDRMSETVTPEEIVEMALKQKAQGIAYTYNEPSIFAEFALDTAKIARKKGLKNIFVSNGYESKETFESVKKYLDAINIDLKSFNPDFYKKVCKADIKPVKENIKRNFAAGIETEITTLIIPGYNDSNEELGNIAEFLVAISPDIPWHISAFYPCYKMMEVSPTPYETLLKAYEIGKKAGLKYVYVGNVPDEKRSSTYCPKCGALLVYRSGYEVEIKDLEIKKGECRKCREKIYGVWH
ncbi:AmmeMemoRadiSam system radical SAM enzyme [Candidatus Microgenomates bacterium]|nr:AmmeMemoRadiSam system radical SAM enzyme [Candidatus Microgenomates bacterium]